MTSFNKRDKSLIILKIGYCRKLTSYKFHHPFFTFKKLTPFKK